MLFAAALLPSRGQQHDQWQDYFQMLLDDDEVEDDMEEVYNLLSELASTPRNINTATREDFEQLPFLTAMQVEELCEYIYKYGGMMTLDELSLLESLDAARRNLLRCFFYAAPREEKKAFPKLSEIAHGATHELTLTAKVPFYERQGDKNGYLGYPYRHSLRYTFAYQNYVKAGLVGAQDAGEPFMAGRNPLGYDHYSFYLQVSGLGRLKTLLAGRYKAKAGMGLVLNTDFGFGKQASLMGLGRSSATVRPSTSRSSANYLQGIAATVELAKGLELTAFASSRYIDATLTKDQTAIQTILKTGYHRTESEMERKNNATMTTIGGHLSVGTGQFSGGVTGVYVSYDKPLQPNTAQLYRRFYAAGSHFWNLSADYSYRDHRFALGGETATGNHHALATINTASLVVSERLSLVAVQRFYSYKYYALLGQSFADGGSVQNESGVYVGASYRAGSALTLNGYVDVAYFPWLRYLVDDSSHSYDCMASATWQKGNMTALMRYRLKIREKNNDEKTDLTNDATHRGRLGVQLSGGNWKVRTQCDMAYNDYKRRSFGWMATQQATWHPTERLQASATAAYFHTKDYASRIYIYEQGPLYSMSFPSFYGHGYHLTMLIRTQLGRRLSALAKLSHTHYFDRSQISSGLQLIDSRQTSDLEVQVRVKL